MSPRAAWRLESLGFRRVYDYVAGKADWMASGLPVDGSTSPSTRIAGIARPSVPRCHLDETIGDVRGRIEGWEICVVVNHENVVLGVVTAKSVGTLDDAQRIDTVMREGPSTFRPDVAVAELAAHLRERKVRRALVTRSDGTLIGLVRAADLSQESQLAERSRG